MTNIIIKILGYALDPGVLKGRPLISVVVSGYVGYDQSFKKKIVAQKPVPKNTVKFCKLYHINLNAQSSKLY